MPVVLRNEEEKPLDVEIVVDGSAYKAEPSSMILHPGISARVSVELIAAARDFADRSRRLVGG